MPDFQTQASRWHGSLPPVLYWGVLGAVVFGAGGIMLAALSDPATNLAARLLLVALLGTLAGILFGSRRASLRRLRCRLDESEGRLQALQRILPVMLQGLDADGRIVYVNQTWFDTLAYRSTQVIGHLLSDFIVAEFPAETLRNHLRTLHEDGEIEAARYRLRGSDGREIDVEVHEFARADKSGAYTGSFAALTKLTRLQVNEEQLEKLIYHDNLTGLPNRHLLNDRLLHTIAQARRDKRPGRGVLLRP